MSAFVMSGMSIVARMSASMMSGMSVVARMSVSVMSGMSVVARMSASVMSGMPVAGTKVPIGYYWKFILADPATWILRLILLSIQFSLARDKYERIILHSSSENK